MENFQLLVCLSEDITILFMNDDNYHYDLDQIMDIIQKQDPTHFRDVQLRILYALLGSIHVAFLNTFGGHTCSEVGTAIAEAMTYIEQHMSPQYMQGL